MQIKPSNNSLKILFFSILSALLLLQLPPLYAAEIEKVLTISQINRLDIAREDYLNGKNFDSTAIYVNGRKFRFNSEKNLNLKFIDSKLTANLGCNTLIGSFKVEKIIFKSNILFLTKAKCFTKSMAEDVWIQRLLSSSPSIYRYNEGIVVKANIVPSLKKGSTIIYLSPINGESYTEPTLASDKEYLKAKTFCESFLKNSTSEKDLDAALFGSGISYRITSRDGEDFYMTMDYSSSRVNIKINSGVVTDCFVG